MKLLIDDIRRLSIVRKGDYKAFENLSREVNGFRRRLHLMGKEDEVENTYVLQEIEGKLNQEDKQKWLESKGLLIDERKVEDLCDWLENQAHLRRLIIGHSSIVEPTERTFNRTKGYMSNPAHAGSSSDCPLCWDSHKITKCPTFIQLNIQEKWDHKKSSSRCFNCLDQNHRSFQCIAPKCDKCKRAHHTLLHNADRTENDTTSKLNSNAIYVTERSHSKGCAKTPKRAFLPIVKAKVKNGENSSTAITLVDMASEVVIISKRLAKSLHLKGSPIAINTVVVGAVITEQITEMVSFFIEDQMKNEIYIEAIVLEEACGDALPIPHELVTEITTNMAINTNCLYKVER